MSKITLSTVGSIQQNPTSATNTINNNNAIIQAAFDNTLSRDSTSPNQMSSSIDMNSNRILNLAAPVAPTDPIRLEDLAAIDGNITIHALPAGGLTGQVLEKNSNTDYDVLWATGGGGGGGGRQQLLANTTFYVRTDGSDSNNGLTNTAGGAFLTWTAAYRIVSSTYDFNEKTVTLFNGNAGTYTGMQITGPWVGGGGLILDFNGGGITDPTTKCILVTGNLSPTGVGTGAPGIGIQNGTFTSSVFSCIQNAGVGSIGIGPNVTFGPTGQYHLEAAATGAIIGVTGANYRITGGGFAHAAARSGGSIYLVATTINIAANVAFSEGFVTAKEGGLMIAGSGTFPGFSSPATFTVTGPRFLVTANATLDAGDATGTYFPGSSPGVCLDNGIYGAFGGGPAQPAVNIGATAGFGMFKSGTGLGLTANSSTFFDYNITNGSKSTLGTPLILSGALTYSGVTLNNAVTGTGNMVLSTSPTLVTPALGAATATTLNGLTFTANSGTLTLNTNTLNIAGSGVTLNLGGVSGKTLTFNNSLTLAGTDSTTMTFPTTTATIARTDAAQTFSGIQTFAGGSSSTPGVTLANAGVGIYSTATNNFAFAVSGGPLLDYNITNSSKTTMSSGVVVTGNLLTTFGGGGIGYGVGAGGAAPQQITNRNTGVTLNKVTGSITLVSATNAAVSAATANSFTFNNSTIAATDTVVISQQSGTDKYLIFVTNVIAGSCQITMFTTGGTTTEAPVFNFTVFKGVAT